MTRFALVLGLLLLILPSTAQAGLWEHTRWNPRPHYYRRSFPRPTYYRVRQRHYEPYWQQSYPYRSQTIYVPRWHWESEF